VRVLSEVSQRIEHERTIDPERLRAMRRPKPGDRRDVPPFPKSRRRAQHEHAKNVPKTRQKRARSASFQRKSPKITGRFALFRPPARHRFRIIGLVSRFRGLAGSQTAIFRPL
jgi:hypothetical protein